MTKSQTPDPVAEVHPNSGRAEGAVCAFLPCRQGSERVPRKNIRPFGMFKSGLLEIKLQQLLDCDAIDLVILSSNDVEILDFAASLSAGSRLITHRRDEALSASATSTDNLVGHARSLVEPLAPDGHILWTHVTSPFVTAAQYYKIVAQYRTALQHGYDSLMTTTLVQSFLWTEEGPLNYDRKVEKWPRTQTLKPLHEINSAAFLAPVSVYKKYEDRIGTKPFMYRLEKLMALDIDWEEDFVIAEQALLNGLVNT